METNTNAITVSTIVSEPVEKVWEAWTRPEHITKWTFASDDWHAPHAENDLKVGGKFTTTMAAKDGSFSFDFGGTYTLVAPFDRIEYTLDDGRKVTISFKKSTQGTEIAETFDPERENPADMQRDGWQAIINNFKKYAESLTL